MGRAVSKKSPEQQEKEWLQKYLAPLAGATILGVGAKIDREEGYPQVWMTLKVSPAGSNEIFDLEISQDQEGNGPGFIFGLPFPEA